MLVPTAPVSKEGMLERRGRGGGCEGGTRRIREGGDGEEKHTSFEGPGVIHKLEDKLKIYS